MCDVNQMQIQQSKNGNQPAWLVQMQKTKIPVKLHSACVWGGYMNGNQPVQCQPPCIKTKIVNILPTTADMYFINTMYKMKVRTTTGGIVELAVKNGDGSGGVRFDS